MVERVERIEKWNDKMACTRRKSRGWWNRKKGRGEGGVHEREMKIEVYGGLGVYKRQCHARK